MENLILILLFVGGAGVYLLPMIIAISRCENPGPVVVINLFLGWTLLGWVAALAMAVGMEKKDPNAKPRNADCVCKGDPCVCGAARRAQREESIPLIKDASRADKVLAREAVLPDSQTRRAMDASPADR